MKYKSVSIGDICDVKGGKRLPKGHEYSPKATPFRYIRVADITDGKIDITSLKFIYPETRERIQRYVVNSGDVIISIAGTIGKTVPVTEEMNDINLTENAAKLVPKEQGIYNSPYLSQVLQSPYAQNQIRKFTGQVTIGKLALFRIKKIQIPLPTLPEQKRIAAILNKTDILSRKRRQVIQLLDDLLESVFLQMFGDPIRNQKGWPLTFLENMILDLRGGSPLKPDDFVDDGFPVLHKGAIKPNGEIELDTKKKTFTHDEFVEKHKRAVITNKYLVVTLRDLIPSGPSIGLISQLIDGPYQNYILAQGAYGFLIDKEHILPEYLIGVTNDPIFRKHVRKYAVGSTQIHIRTPVYFSIKIPLPPLDQQKRFSRMFNKIRKLKAMESDAIRFLDTLFKSLQQLAFRGEL